jgi:breast cancer 2 susceptibility protein
MLAGAPRQALGKRRLDVDAAAAVSASRFQKQKTGRAGISGAPSVHDLFASRGARREGYAAFFGGLRPSERPPSRHAPHGSARLGFVSSDLAAGLRVADAEGRALGARELRRRMLAAGCVARLLDADWVQNAYRWVVWHHACVVRSFPETLTDGLLTASAVEQRLLYRYQRETLGASRPFLRRVWERDAPASAPAVLVVAAIRRMPFLRNDELVQNDAQNDDAFANGAELELSDGWYGAPARCDAATTRLVRSGVLRVGAKILTQGLELMPKDGEPASPLADEALDNWLALRRNQVRPVPWDAKLGARPGSATAFSLRSIEADGGAVKKVLLFVERVYPSTWMESDRPDGKRVHRSELAETRAARAWEQARAAALERLADALARERATRGIDDGAAEARARAELERRGLFERRTRRAARFRVSGVRSTRKGGLPLPIGLERSTGSALLTVYDLDEDAAARLATSEGATFEVTDVVARLEKKEGGLELIASRRSRWRRVTPSVLARANLEPKPTPRRLATVRDLADDDVSRDVARDVARDGARGVRFGEEFDCVAAIVRVARATPVGAPASQWVFLADASVGSGFGSGFGTRAADFELLAVETRVAHAEAFVDAEAWGAGTGFETRGEGVGEKKGDARGGDGGSFAVVPVALENLTYVRRDAANGVRVAAFTERSRATPMFESGDARETRYAKQKRETPFGSGPNAPLAARQARALRRGLGEGSDAATARLRDALLARVRALTGSASPPSASEPEPRSGFDAERVATNGDAASKANREGGFGFASEPGRRKRSLSLGSEAEWGASQLAHIEAVEAKALEARRSRKCAETQ